MRVKDKKYISKTGKGNGLHMTLLKGGKPVEWGRYKVSADGKTLHATEGGVGREADLVLDGGRIITMDVSDDAASLCAATKAARPVNLGTRSAIGKG